MPGGNLKVHVDKVTQLGNHAKDLAAHLTSMPSRHSQVSVPPAFGDKTAGSAFQDAQRMLSAYQNQVEKFVGSNSNLTDLVNQFKLMKTGTDSIVADYNAGIITEANAANEFKNAMGGSSTTGA
jgi:hypothetical protein